MAQAGQGTPGQVSPYNASSLPGSVGLADGWRPFQPSAFFFSNGRPTVGALIRSHLLLGIGQRRADGKAGHLFGRRRELPAAYYDLAVKATHSNAAAAHQLERAANDAYYFDPLLDGWR